MDAQKTKLNRMNQIGQYVKEFKCQVLVKDDFFYL